MPSKPGQPTPGEWKVTHDTESGQPIVVATLNGEYVHWPIALVDAPDAPNGRRHKKLTSPQMESNACLFAAAKDLLSLAHDYLKDWHDGHDMADGTTAAECQRGTCLRIKAVISKAEGRG